MFDGFRGPPEQEPCTVLVVEDEPLIRLIVAEELRGSGMRVIEAETADEALERPRAGIVHFVFADIEFPGSMNGVELRDGSRRIFPISESSRLRVECRRMRLPPTAPSFRSLMTFPRS